MNDNPHIAHDFQLLDLKGDNQKKPKNPKF